MTEQAIHTLVEQQRAHFLTGATLNIDRRLETLSKLKACIQRHEGEIAGALRQDLGKSGFESYVCETGMVLEELTYMLKHAPLPGSKRFPLPWPSFTPAVTGSPPPAAWPSS